MIFSTAMRPHLAILQRRVTAIATVALFTSTSGIGYAAGLQATDAYLADLATWKAERVSRLKGPDGFLNLVGLFWLRKDTSTFGSSPDNDFVLPAGAAPVLGSFHKEDGKVRMAVRDGIEVLHGETPVQSIVMDDDHSENPVVLTHGSLAWTVIRRDDKYAVRVRDFEHPAIAAFGPIDYFPADLALRVPAVLQRFDEPRQLRVDTVIEGLDYRPESPGILRFEIDGEPFELEAYQSGDELFLIFGDATSGRETYPAGRFLYTSMPDESGVTMLDFNKAYNPPCAFNAFATCPVASPQNRLKTRISAGEKYDLATTVPASGH
jgi:uncharacterized protein (DUF1684 family)